jgi:hypothetical protein
MPGMSSFRDPPYHVLSPGRASGAGTAGGGQPAVAPTPVVFPPEIYPIPGAVLFSISTVPPGLAVATGAPVVLLTIPIPAQSKGVLNVVEYGANNFTVASLLTFNIRFNQGAIGYGPLAISPSRNATFAGESKNPLIRIPLGVAVVDLIVSVGAADGATYLCGGTLEGWYWTLANEQAYNQGRTG